jgi:hypothetical protein
MPTTFLLGDSSDTAGIDSDSSLMTAKGGGVGTISFLSDGLGGFLANCSLRY